MLELQTANHLQELCIAIFLTRTLTYLEMLGVDPEFADPAADGAQLNHAPIRGRAHVKPRSWVQVHDGSAV
jgi:hypothetical protein